MEGTITSKGQVTIPKPIRDALGIDAGDRVDFHLGKDGTVTLVPVTRPIASLKGMLPKPQRAVTLEEMEAAIARGASRR